MMIVPALAFSWWLMSVPARPAAALHSPSAPRRLDDAATISDPNLAEVPHAARPYRGVITAALARAARTFLDLPMGAERLAEVEGRRFVFVLERHYHPPGFVGGPTGWHKGVTVYAALDDTP